MKKIILFIAITLFAILRSAPSLAQINDFCFTLKDNSPLLSALCFEKTMGKQIECYMAKVINPATTGIKRDVDGQLYVIPDAYVITEYKEQYAGITRASFDLTNNLRLITASIPFKDNDVEVAQIAIIAIVDGEATLLCNETCTKEKFNTGTNVSIYSITPSVNKLKINGEYLQMFITLFYKDGTILYGIKIGKTFFKIN